MDPYLERIGKYLKAMTQLALAFSGIGLVLATLRIFIWARGDFDMFVHVAGFVNLISQASILGILSLATFLMIWIVGLVFFVPRTRFFSKLNLSVFTILPLALLLMPWWFSAIYGLGIFLAWGVRKIEKRFSWISEARRNHDLSLWKILILVMTNTLLLLGTSTGFASDLDFRTPMNEVIRGKGFVGQNTILLANPQLGSVSYFQLSEVQDLKVRTEAKDVNGVPLANIMLDLLNLH